jgi:hypothetical protein
MQLYFAAGFVSGTALAAGIFLRDRRNTPVAS